MFEMRVMDQSEAHRIGEIDRSENVMLGYWMRDGRLEARPVDWQVPRWYEEGTSPHSVPYHVAACARLLEQGSTMIGAFDGDALVGLTVYRPHLAQGLGQLAMLVVSNGHRRQGIAARLTAEVERLAQQDGARQLYVSATPSGSAVGFYRSRGFEPVAEPHPELFALEPEDIHMTKTL